MTEKYYGHATKTDGTHVALTSDEARELWESCERATAKREADMPTSIHALDAICQAKERMRELGWSDGIYCPKNGDEFAVVQLGSTGIFAAAYVGEWPKGDIWLGDESMSPQAGMWKPLDKLTDDERAMMEKCIADHRDWMERQFKSFEAMDRMEGRE